MRAGARTWEGLDDNSTYNVHKINVGEECMRWSMRQGGAHRNGGANLKRGPTCKHGCLDQCGGILFPYGPTRSPRVI